MSIRAFASLPEQAPRLIVIEANRELRLALQVLFHAHGWSVRSAFDLASARDSVRDFPPHAILVDPYLDDDRADWNLAPVLADGAFPRPSLVAMVSRWRRGAQDQAARHGYDACFFKPLDFDALRHCIALLLGDPPICPLTSLPVAVPVGH